MPAREGRGTERVARRRATRAHAAASPATNALQADAYPAGHPPADPPGSCGPSCLCMDGTRKHDEWERRKSWIEASGCCCWSGQQRRRHLLAPPGPRMRAVGEMRASAWTPSPRTRSVLARGRVSGQHFLEPAAGAAAARGPGPAEEPLAPCE
ncbi:unnamed protein product, partial [Prorocentrum cordatum]